MLERRAAGRSGGGGGGGRGKGSSKSSADGGNSMMGSRKGSGKKGSGQQQQGQKQQGQQQNKKLGKGKEKHKPGGRGGSPAGKGKVVQGDKLRSLKHKLKKMKSG